MHRYGGGIELVEHAQSAGLRTVGVAIHPPLAGSDDEHRDDIVRRLPDIDPSLDVWVSHLAPATYAALPRSHRYKLRIGHLPVAGRPRGAPPRGRRARHPPGDGRGAQVGYRLTTVDVDGTLVMIGAGSANGVAPLADDASPFHFARTRMALVEPPHMHTSMVFVPAGQPCPRRRRLGRSAASADDDDDRRAAVEVIETRHAHRPARRSRRRARGGDGRRRDHELPRLPDHPRRRRARAAGRTTSSTRGSVRCRRASRPRSCSPPASASRCSPARRSAIGRAPTSCGGFSLAAA